MKATNSPLAPLLVVALSIAFLLAIAPVVVHADVDTLFGPATFVRGTAKPVTETRQFSLAGFRAPFTLHLRNGDEDGSHRTSSAKVWLNGQLLLDASAFSQRVASHEIAVDLADPSTLAVWMASAPGSKLTMWIEGEVIPCAQDLIAAINAANATAAPDVISLTCDAVLDNIDNVTHGPNGLPAITTPIVIEGNGHSIRRAAGAPQFRIFTVLGGFLGDGDLTLDNVTVSGGDINVGSDCFLAVDQCGGGVLNYFGRLTVRNSRFLGNTAFGGGAVYNAAGRILIDASQFGSAASPNTADYGGALYNVFSPGTVTTLNSSFTGNRALLSGGAIHNQAELFVTGSVFTSNTVTGIAPFGGGGGAIHNNSISGQVAIATSTFTENGAVRGGAVSNYNASDIVIHNSVFSNNSNNDMPFGAGGAIWSDNNAYLEIQSSRITGNRTGTGFIGNGGGIFAGGGLNSELVLVNSTVSDNAASNDGGGIYMNSNNAAVVSYIMNSSISGNSAGRDGGGIHKDGFSPVNIIASEISDNSVPSPNGNGGGLFFDNPTSTAHAHTITATTIARNRAGEGGGLYSDAFTGTITIRDSTIYDNTVVTTGALGEGGAGLSNQHGNIDIVNTTISGNRVENSAGTLSGSGAAIHHGNGGVVSVSYSTLANNASRDGGGIRAQSTVTVANSILANTAVNGPNCNPVFVITDGGNNFVDDGSNCPAGFVVSASINLGPLADNGGTRLTHALLPGSVAIDAAGACGLADERGITRDAACDSGAYEAIAVVAPLLAFDVATSSVGEGALLSVNVTLDNTAGNVANGAVAVNIPLTGTAAYGTDYDSPTVLPLTFSGATWPAPGTSVTQAVVLDVRNDARTEGSETIVLTLGDVGIVGPAELGGITQHTVTIADSP